MEFLVCNCVGQSVALRAQESVYTAGAKETCRL